MSRLAITEQQRRVYVGCAFPGIRVHKRGSRKGQHQAFCSCGWTGPRRRFLVAALKDEGQHTSSAGELKERDDA